MYSRHCVVDGADNFPVLDLLLVAAADAPEFTALGTGRSITRTDGFGKEYTSYGGALCVFA